VPHGCGNNERYQLGMANNSMMNPAVPSVLQNLKPFNIIKISTGKIVAATTASGHLLIWGMKSSLFQNGDFYLKYQLRGKVDQISVNGNESKKL
jgi:alpha-tubulin suppressor-like RCC1 family protein